MFRLSGTDRKKFYSWILKTGRYRIGRHPDSDLCIPQRTVSREHAVLEVDTEGEHCFLLDLGSHNGTAVNGRRIVDRTPVRQGDLIQFGDTEFKLTFSDDPSGSPRIMPGMTLVDDEVQNSHLISIDEALKVLPEKVPGLPNLLPTLFEMAKFPVLSEPRDDMLARSLKLISRVIPCERLLILFVSEDRKEVYPAASLLPEGGNQEDVTLSRTIVREVITNKNAILISDAAADPRFSEQESIIMSRLNSAIAVPLFDEGRVLGILYVDTTNPLHLYNDDHLRILATFGNIIASRLLNYLLLQERQQKQIIEAELERAASIQKSLLLATPPAVPGWNIHVHHEQSRSVGGDFFDFHYLPDGRLFVLAGDVSGKGLGAALLMAHVLASIRIFYASDRFDLARLVTDVSRQLYRYSASIDFATLFTGILDPATGRLVFVNAGHNFPCLIHENGKTELLESSGTMIGAFDFSTWNEDVVHLSEGDLLFIYTDGVTEASNGTEEYGEERLTQLLITTRNIPPEEIATTVMKDIIEFEGDTPRSDDITIVLIKRQ
jgi:serine phosphatase RsbU (regulator of sigma subunit)